MPTRPLGFCAMPGCANRASGLCAQHKAKRKQDMRESASRRGYDAKWRTIRDDYLLRHPMCESGCGRRAELVDHILPIRRGGTNDERNLQALCRSCHAKKTRRDG